MKRVFNLLLAGLILAASVIPVLPQQEARAAPSYPVLPAGLNYYQTTFPAGLVYSPEWYGTFTSAPKAQAILLFDDDWLPDWGRAIFAMNPAPGKQPSGAQGGTTLTPITRDAADAIIQSYNISNFAPVDPEILQVMPRELRFTGVWAGDKLAQKWTADTPPLSSLTQKQIDYLKTTQAAINIKKAQTIIAIRDFDPDRFWVPNDVTGNWNNTAMWANASGNMSGGASVPTNADNTFFDVNSFNSANKTVTVNVAASTLSMNWTGATNTPTLAGSASLSFYGSLTLINMLVTGNSTWAPSASSGSHTITTNGISLTTINGLITTSGGTATYTLQDALNLGTTFLMWRGGTLNTNGKQINTSALYMTTINTLTLGASVINATIAVDMSTTVTLTANTATFNVSGTGYFYGGNKTTYNIVNLNGTAHTITGNNTMAALNFNPAGAQTITATGTTQTVAVMSRTGTGQISLNGSYVDSSGTNSLDYMTITNSAASGGATFNAIGGSVNGGGNTGWNFPLTIATGASSGVAMDKDGVTAATIAGTITDMGGSATVGAWFDYGLTTGYGSTTTNVTYSTTNFTGTKTQALPTTLTPGQTYQFRRAITSGANTTYGADDNFTLTSPTPLTNSALNISMDKDGVTSGSFSGNVTSMGAATSTYGLFQHGLTVAYGTNTSNSSLVATGNFLKSIPTGLIPAQTYHYRTVLVNGTVNVTGADSSFVLTMPSVTTGAATNIGTPSGIPTATLHGTVPTFGVASSAYAGMRWWTDPAAKTDTETSVLGAGAYSVIITNYDRTLPVSYQSYVRVGSVYVLGAVQTFTEASESSFNLLRALLTLILAAGTIVWVARNGMSIASLLAILIGIIAIAVVNGIIG